MYGVVEYQLSGLVCELPRSYCSRCVISTVSAQCVWVFASVRSALSLFRRETELEVTSLERGKRIVVSCIYAIVINVLSLRR